MAWTRCWWPSQDIVAGTARTALVGGALIFPITVLLLLGGDIHFPRAWNKWSESGRKPRSRGNTAPSCDIPFPWERAWNGPTAYPPGDHGAVQGPGRPWTQEYELRRPAYRNLGLRRLAVSYPSLSQAIVQADGHRNEGLEISSWFSGG